MKDPKQTEMPDNKEICSDCLNEFEPNEIRTCSVCLKQFCDYCIQLHEHE